MGWPCAPPRRVCRRLRGHAVPRQPLPRPRVGRARPAPALVVLLAAHPHRDPAVHHPASWSSAGAGTASRTAANWIVGIGPSSRGRSGCMLKYFLGLTYFVVTNRRVIYRPASSPSGASRSRSSGSTTSTSTSASSTASSAPATSTSSRRARTARRTSTSCATPTACSRRSTGRWRRATCPAASRGSGRRGATPAASVRADRGARPAARPGPHHPDEFEAKKAELLDRM